MRLKKRVLASSRRTHASFCFQAEDGIRDLTVTGVQTCALPILLMFYHGLIAFDHVQHRLWIVRNVFTEGHGSLRAKYDAAVREIRQTRKLLEEPVAAERPRTSWQSPKRAAMNVSSNFRRPEYLDIVRKAKQYIRAGD